MDFTHPDDLEEDLKLFKKFQNKEIPNYSLTKRFIKKDGSAIWANMIIDHLVLGEEREEDQNHICIVRDINDTIEAEKALRDSERSKSIMLSHLPGMAYKCKVEDALKMEYVSEGCFELTGYEPEKLIDRNEKCYFDLIYPEEKKLVNDKYYETIKSGKNLKAEYRIKTKDNQKKWVLEQGQAIIDNSGNNSMIEGLIIDITESKQRELEIMYMSEHDSLTGIYNRMYFFNKIKEIDIEENLPISVIVGNINGMRLINNAFGNETGDFLIKETTRIINSCCRKTYLLARTGGDDFSIILPKTEFRDALEVVDLMKSKCDLFSSKIKDSNININISFGCDTKNKKQVDIMEVIGVAQDYMYKRKLLDRKSSHRDILSTITASLFARSQETEEHADRLAKVAHMIGRVLNLPKQENDFIELVALLHDIGKMGISDNILNKPGKLTDEEWKIMKKHPEIGYKIAIASPELEPIAEFILTHHERWDGKGYPKGLMGEDIPLVSRIISVADAFDAMTEDRVYRKAMNKEMAVEEINNNSGKQFDPEVVEAFNKIVNDI